MRMQWIAVVITMSLLRTPAADCQTAQAAAQRPGQETAKSIRDYRRAHATEILASFRELLSMPNVARATPEGHHDIEANANYIREEFEKRGVKTQILNVDGGFPAVYGELKAPNATKTVVFYAHYDGQPVHEKEWVTPPFAPSLRTRLDASSAVEWPAVGAKLPETSDDWLLFARSASDDKAPIIGFLIALDALKAMGKSPSVNLKFFLEGEEEQGSEHLAAMLSKYKELLKSDLWILCDGPTNQSGSFQLVYGARGVMGLEMTTFGPSRALHSGHYGNWAPNPAMEMASILATMRDTDGRILIPGFYEPARKLTAEERSAIAAMPDVDSGLKKELQLGRTEGGGRKLAELVMEPAMNVRGIQAGATGAQAANAIMPTANASIDFRLVPDQTPEGVRAQVEAHLTKLGYFITYETPAPDFRRAHEHVIQLQWEQGYAGFKTPLKSAPADIVVRTMEKTLGAPVLRVPLLGGSVPMSVFDAEFHRPIVLLPIANYDNNQHASNENIRLRNFWSGVEIFASLFAEMGEGWR